MADDPAIARVLLGGVVASLLLVTATGIALDQLNSRNPATEARGVPVPRADLGARATSVKYVAASARASEDNDDDNEGWLVELHEFSANMMLFFVGLHASPVGSWMWPLLVVRLSSVPVLIAVAALTCGVRPGMGFPWRLVVISGVFDTLANVFFLLATRAGDLGVSAVVVSLYPVVVALLAGVVLRERLTALQLGGAGLAVGASVLLAVGG